MQSAISKIRPKIGAWLYRASPISMVFGPFMLCGNPTIKSQTSCTRTNATDASARNLLLITKKIVMPNKKDQPKTGKTSWVIGIFAARFTNEESKKLAGINCSTPSITKINIMKSKNCDATRSVNAVLVSISFACDRGTKAVAK